MKERFETLFYVKSSLITLYLALTIPIPLISSQSIRIYSVIAFLFGFILIVNITNDYVKTCDKRISYKTGFFSRFFGKRDWEILWKDIRIIKSFPTSQGSKVHYFITHKNESYLLPQRIENLEQFVSLIATKTNLKVEGITYISQLWTYKILTLISITMIIGELVAFCI